MPRTSTRRQFLGASAAAGAALGGGEFAALLPFSPVSAEEATVTPEHVRFTPEIEPLVRCIEDTPREQCPAMLIGQLQHGATYRSLLSALFLANMRTIGNGHPAAVVHSANRLTFYLPHSERLLPLFWAVDSFKFEQERSRAGHNLKALTGRLPSAEQAEGELRAGMEGYDPERVERAVAALARAAAPARVAEPLWYYGARDWTFIGHNAIWIANGWRVLETIGWQHAEPCLRAIARDLIGDQKGLATQPYAANVQRVKKAAGSLPADWARSGASPGLTKDLLALIRERNSGAACDLALAHLVDGKAAGTVWDAIHLAAGEIILNKPWDGGTALHASTVSNALHYAFQASATPETRLLILLQGVGWMCLHRGTVADSVRKGQIPELRELTGLTAAEVPAAPEAAAREILALRASHPYEAAAKALAFARRWPDPHVLLREAGRLLPLKSSWNPHELKFPLAMFEKYAWVSPEWRPHLLAAATFSFKGTEDLDSPVVSQVRDALVKL